MWFSLVHKGMTALSGCAGGVDAAAEAVDNSVANCVLPACGKATAVSFETQAALGLRGRGHGGGLVLGQRL